MEVLNMKTKQEKLMKDLTKAVRSDKKILVITTPKGCGMSWSSLHIAEILNKHLTKEKT